MTEPKRTKRAKPNPERLKLTDSLLTNYKKLKDLIGENGLLKQLAKTLQGDLRVAARHSQ